jgi:hypothetical protein
MWTDEGARDPVLVFHRALRGRGTGRGTALVEIAVSASGRYLRGGGVLGADGTGADGCGGCHERLAASTGAEK